MKSKTIKMLACSAAFGMTLLVPAFAQPGPGAGMGPGNGPGWSLMSPAERETHWTAMRAAKTVDECKALQAQNHALLEGRAKERGITLPAANQNACERLMAGGRPGPGPGAGSGYAGGPRSPMGPGGGAGRGPAAGLLTPEEMSAHRNAMRSVKTIEECKTMQSEHRALVETRAKEKGVTVPAPRANACERMFQSGAKGQPGAKGPAGTRGGAPGWNLMTAEEREAHRTQMRSVKSYEECKAVQLEHRTKMEERAKAKGMTLPEPRQQGCDRMKARGMIQ